LGAPATGGAPVVVSPRNTHTHRESEREIRLRGGQERKRVRGGERFERERVCESFYLEVRERGGG